MDFVAFDEASRGPWGSLLLLIRCRLMFVLTRDRQSESDSMLIGRQTLGIAGRSYHHRNASIPANCSASRDLSITYAAIRHIDMYPKCSLPRG